MPVVSFNSMAGGVADLEPRLLPPETVQRAVNVTFRGLGPRTRPGFRYRAASSDNPRTEFEFERGYLQGAFEFRPDSSPPLMVLVIDGNIMLFDPETGDLTKQNAPEGRMATTAERVWAKQRGNTLVIQDNVNRPRIVSTGSTRVADASKQEVPVGASMGNGHGRLTVATPFRRGLYAGDHELAIGVVPGVGLHTFTDGNYYLNGASLQPPAEFGRIVGQEYVSQYDTSTGVGALVVLSEFGVSAFATNTPRTSWAENDISLAILPGANNGCLSPDAIVPYGEDLFYLSPEGLKSVRTARAANLPYQIVNLTADVAPIWEQAPEKSRRFSSMIAHDRRILYTVGAKLHRPDARPPRVTFQGILAYNLDRLNGRVDKPIQDGVWTGLDVQRLVTVGGRAFAVAWYQGRNRIFEIDPSTQFDQGPDGADRAPKCELYMRAELFNAVDQWKSADRAFVSMHELLGAVDIELYAYIDKYPRLLAWGAIRHTAGYRVQVETHEPRDRIPSFQPHPHIRRRFGAPEDGDDFCDPTTGRRFTQFREIQPVLVWHGAAAFGSLEVDAHEIPRADELAGCVKEETAIALDENPANLYTYKVSEARTAEVTNYVESTAKAQA